MIIGTNSKKLPLKVFLALLTPILLGIGMLANFSREILIASTFGTNNYLDIYRVSAALPIALFQSLGSVYTGLYLSRVKKSQQLASQFGSISQATLLVTVIGVLSAPLYVCFMLPRASGDMFSLAVFSVVICWMAFLSLLYYYQARIVLQLNSLTNFVAGTSALSALAFCIALLLLSKWYSGSTLLLQVCLFFSFTVISLIFWLKVGIELPFRDVLSQLTKHGDELRNPNSLGLILVAIATHLGFVAPKMVDRLIASHAGEGLVSALEYAMSLYNALGILFGTSLVILSAKFIADSHLEPKFLWQLMRRASLPIFCGTSIAALFYAFSHELVELVFERGAFNSSDTVVTSDFLSNLCIAIPILILNTLLIQVIYAYGGKWPMIILAGVKIGTKLLLVKFLAGYSVGQIVGISNLGCEVAFLLTFLLIMYRLGLGNMGSLNSDKL